MISRCKILQVETANYSQENLSQIEMIKFTFSSGVAVSVTCALIILSLACGARAVLFSTKPPRPFRQLCKVTLVTNILLMLITGIQPWIFWDINFVQEFVGTCTILVSLATMLVCMERVFALKFPLKYIRCTVDDKFASHLVAWSFFIIICSYLFVRFLMCYMLQYTVEINRCEPYRMYSVLSLEGLIVSTATVCFAIVLFTTAKSKRQHTRRITRMGLPQNHALNSTDTHVSATLFILYPFAVCLAVFSVLLDYWRFIPDDTVSHWLSLAIRIVHCAMHGVLFNSWFDEWRLHFITVLSPFSANLRDLADIMRINVYNIVVAEAVVAEAFDGSRLQLEGSIKSRKISRSRLSNSSKISTISASLSLKSHRTSTQEENNRAKISRLESISEAEV